MCDEYGARGMSRTRSHGALQTLTRSLVFILKLFNKQKRRIFNQGVDLTRFLIFGFFMFWLIVYRRVQKLDVRKPVWNLVTWARH